MPKASQALVIGNGAYSGNLKLSCPPNDATAIDAILADLGFEVTGGAKAGVNLNFDQTEALVGKFIALVNAPETSVSLLYYSGHGLQINDQNYIVPVDFDAFASQNIAKLVSVQSIVEKMTSATAIRIVLLDACRSNADARTFVGGKGIEIGKEIRIDNQIVPPRGLASMAAANNTFIAFAAGPGEVAFDGSEGDFNSPFTASLARNLDAVDLPISNLTSRVRQDVKAHTGNRQTTWDQSSLLHPFYFNPGNLLLFTGNLMALVSLLLSMVPYTLTMRWVEAPPLWIALASTLPLLSLAILLFGTQNVYARLRGNVEEDRRTSDLAAHILKSAQKGILGGYLGSSVASLVLGCLYYANWRYLSDYALHVSFAQILIEITLATAMTACLLGSLALFFSRLAIIGWKVTVSENRSPIRLIAGATVGGWLAGVVSAPLLTMYFGRFERPEMTPALLLPGSLVGASILIFSIVNFDFERLSSRRVWASVRAAVAALAFGLVSAGVIFGILYPMGVVGAVTDYLRVDSQNLARLALGGAAYGLPVGGVLGIVIGTAIVLTERWSQKPVLD